VPQTSRGAVVGSLARQAEALAQSGHPLGLERRFGSDLFRIKRQADPRLVANIPSAVAGRLVAVYVHPPHLDEPSVVKGSNRAADRLTLALSRFGVSGPALGEVAREEHAEPSRRASPVGRPLEVAQRSHLVEYVSLRRS
jgi:hypothetical protein